MRIEELSKNLGWEIAITENVIFPIEIADRT